MALLGADYAHVGRLDEAEPLLLEALAGSRAALDRNHQVAQAALASLAAVYSGRGDMKKLGAVLMEALQVTQVRNGPDHPFTAFGNQSVGMFFLAQKDYAKAEAYLREHLAFCVKNHAEEWDRFASESVLGYCLIGQKKYAEAEQRLLSAYNGMKVREKSTPAGHEADLRKVVEQILLLCKDAGKLLNKATLDEIRADPRFQELERDVKFPANAFAP